MESHSADRAQLSNQITDHIFRLPLPHNQGTANTKDWSELGLMLLLFMCIQEALVPAQAPTYLSSTEHGQHVEADRQDLTSLHFLGPTEHSL